MTTGLAAVSAASGTLGSERQEYWVFLGTYTGEKSKGIYVSRLAVDGQLSPPELAATTPNPAFLTVDPRERFLYAANEIGSFQGGKAGSVSAYAINAVSGKLTRLNEVSAITPGPCHVSVDATGQVVMVANYGGGSISSFPVRADGSLGAAVTTIRQSGSSVNRDRQNEPHAHWIGADPTNRYVLLCDLGLDQVLVFQLDPLTATLKSNEPPFARASPAAGPRHLAFRPDGKFAYVINELDCTMTVFAWNSARGELTPVQTMSTLPPGEPIQAQFSTAEVVVHPSGRFLYGSNRRHDSIVAYAIDELSGELTLIEHVSSGGAVPRNFNVDPSGRFLLSANQESGNVVVLRIDENTGRLTPTGAAITIEKPVCVVFARIQ